MKLCYCITFDQDAAGIPAEKRMYRLFIGSGGNGPKPPYAIFDQGDIDVSDNATFSEVIQMLSNGHKTMDWRKQHPNIPLQFEVKYKTSI